MHFKYNFLTLSVMESKMELKWWGGWLHQLLVQLRIFLHKIVIKFWSQKSKLTLLELVFKTAGTINPHPPPPSRIGFTSRKVTIQIKNIVHLCLGRKLYLNFILIFFSALLWCACTILKFNGAHLVFVSWSQSTAIVDITTINSRHNNL